MFSKILFGQRILEQRKKHHETQVALAELLDVKSNHISGIECGKRTTSAERIALICQHYKVSADYLLGLTDDPEPKYKAETEG